LRFAETAQSFDAASADFFRFVPQMCFERSPYIGSNIRFHFIEVFDGLGGQDYGEWHFG
jgi:hypothetical protein